MIPQADIVAWRQIAPWADDALVEQDLVLSRALINIFDDRTLATALALRGGTALHKVMLVILSVRRSPTRLVNRGLLPRLGAGRGVHYAVVATGDSVPRSCRC